MNVASRAKLRGELRLLPSSCGGSTDVSFTVNKSVINKLISDMTTKCVLHQTDISNEQVRLYKIFIFLTIICHFCYFTVCVCVCVCSWLSGLY